MKHYNYIILGGGASGLMMAFRMASDSYFDDKSILIIEKVSNKGNDRTWSYWENGNGEWDDIVFKSWSNIYFGSQWFSKSIKTGSYSYKTIRSQDFYNRMYQLLCEKSNFEILNEEVIDCNDNGKKVRVNTSQNLFTADKVLNSIIDKEYLNQNKYPVLRQHFLGWFIKTDTETFDDSLATFMDFNIPQNGNTRFMYILPFTKKEALFEYTLFSKDVLEKSEYENEIKAYLKTKKIDNYKIVEKEFGIIPMTSYKFYKHNSQNILNIGTAGGWTKASTGFTFKNTSRKTKEVISFLKTKNDFKKFQKVTKFWFYDLIFLDVLSNNNEYGSKVFSSLFKRTSLQTVFQFLDETSSIKQDINVISSVPPLRFIRALIKRIF